MPSEHRNVEQFQANVVNWPYLTVILVIRRRWLQFFNRKDNRWLLVYQYHQQVRMSAYSNYIWDKWSEPKMFSLHTGDIRFWPSIAHDGSSIDESGILEGQEFDELLSIPPIGYVLVTTTCNLVLLQFQLSSGRHTIVHKAVRTPSGFLGSIGKKFASIIIGSNAQERENVRNCVKISTIVFI